MDTRLLLTPEAAEYMRLTVRQFERWADRHGVPRLKVGRSNRWELHILRAYLERKAWTRRRAAPRTAPSQHGTGQGGHSHDTGEQSTGLSHSCE